MPSATDWYHKHCEQLNQLEPHRRVHGGVATDGAHHSVCDSHPGSFGKKWISFLQSFLKREEEGTAAEDDKHVTCTALQKWSMHSSPCMAKRNQHKCRCILRVTDYIKTFTFGSDMKV